MAGQLDSLFKNVAKQIVSDLGSSFDSSIVYTTTDTSYSIKGPNEFIRSEEDEGKYNVASQGTGSINNILDVYPWLQSYLGSYMIGGAGAFQMRVVRG